MTNTCHGTEPMVTKDVSSLPSAKSSKKGLCNLLRCPGVIKCSDGDGDGDPDR